MTYQLFQIFSPLLKVVLAWGEGEVLPNLHLNLSTTNWYFSMRISSNLNFFYLISEFVLFQNIQDCFFCIFHFSLSYHTTHIITFTYETKIGMDLREWKIKAVQVPTH